MLHEQYYVEKAKQECLLARKNEPARFYNGIFTRYKNPLLTREHIPLTWRYDLDTKTNPFFEERHEFIKTILGESGANVHIEPDFWCDYGYRIKVGENFYANHGLVILDGGGVTFGDNVFIAPSCGFHTAGHPIDFERRNQGLEYAYPIVVGDNVWIGAGVQVMPGVTIGSNVVIGGGSIVTKDIPSDSVAVGNPCRVIRKITEDDRQRNWDRKTGG